MVYGFPPKLRRAPASGINHRRQPLRDRFEKAMKRSKGGHDNSRRQEYGPPGGRPLTSGHSEPLLLGELVEVFANAPMCAETDAVCGAAYGESSPQRVNHPNGYRDRPFHTRAGSIERRI